MNSEPITSNESVGSNCGCCVCWSGDSQRRSTTEKNSTGASQTAFRHSRLLTGRVGSLKLLLLPLWEVVLLGFLSCTARGK